MDELGSEKDRVEGIEPPDFDHEPETVSAPLPQDSPRAHDPAFEGTVGFERSQGLEQHQERRVLDDLEYQRRREEAVFDRRRAATQRAGHGSHGTAPMATQAASEPSIASEQPAAVRRVAGPSTSAGRVPAHGTSREPFVREPRPHRTQQPINLMSEDDEASGIDYSHESTFTTRRGMPLSGAGYRRSRNDAARFKKDLKYGQYLEVPKGRRDLFASQRQVRNRRVAAAVIIAAVIVVLIIVILNLTAA